MCFREGFWELYHLINGALICIAYEMKGWEIAFLSRWADNVNRMGDLPSSVNSTCHYTFGPYQPSDLSSLDLLQRGNLTKQLGLPPSPHCI